MKLNQKFMQLILLIAILFSHTVSAKIVTKTILLTPSFCNLPYDAKYENSDGYRNTKGLYTTTTQACSLFRNIFEENDQEIIGDITRETSDLHNWISDLIITYFQHHNMAFSYPLEHIKVLNTSKFLASN